MPTAPAPFLRFLSDNVKLVTAIFDRGDVDESELLSLIERFQDPQQASAAHLRMQIEELGIVERAAHADGTFELSPVVQELLRWLMHRQRLSGATVLRGYFDELSVIGSELEVTIAAGDVAAVVLALRDVDGLVERIRALSSGNREAIVTEAQALRSVGSEISAVERVRTVRRLWEHFLEPLRQLVDVRGEMEQRADALRRALEEGERRFAAHGAVYRATGRTLARVARMRREVFTDHMAAMREIAPLYERLRRDSRWVLGASRALRTVRSTGTASIDLERQLALVGWRTRYLMSDEKLLARLTELATYAPEGPVFLSAPPPVPNTPVITRHDLHAVLSSAAPVDDVLDFVLTQWPHHPVDTQLAAFGEIIGGSFGAVHIAEDAAERPYRARDLVIRAWPVGLREVAA